MGFLQFTLGFVVGYAIVLGIKYLIKKHKPDLAKSIF